MQLVVDAAAGGVAAGAPGAAPALPPPGEVEAALESAGGWSAGLLGLAFQLQEVAKWAELDAFQVGVCFPSPQLKTGPALPTPHEQQHQHTPTRLACPLLPPQLQVKALGRWFMLVSPAERVLWYDGVFETAAEQVGCASRCLCMQQPSR